MWAAYRATRYVAITDESEIVIRVDQRSPALDARLAADGLVSWCFITAANPNSKLLGAAENADRNEALQARIEAAGLEFLHGEGRGETRGEARGETSGEGNDEAGNWPAEPSFLVLGLSRECSVELARAFEQVAVVFGEIGRAAELVDCRVGTGARG